MLPKVDLRCCLGLMRQWRREIRRSQSIHRRSCQTHRTRIYTTRQSPFPFDSRISLLAIWLRFAIGIKLAMNLDKLFLVQSTTGTITNEPLEEKARVRIAADVLLRWHTSCHCRISGCKRKRTWPMNVRSREKMPTFFTPVRIRFQQGKF